MARHTNDEEWRAFCIGKLTIIAATTIATSLLIATLRAVMSLLLRHYIFVRGLSIATGQNSSSCVSGVDLNLGGDDIEDGAPDREQVDCERDEVEVGGKEKETNTKREQTHAQT